MGLPVTAAVDLLAAPARETSAWLRCAAGAAADTERAKRWRVRTGCRSENGAHPVGSLRSFHCSPSHTCQEPGEGRSSRSSRASWFMYG